MVLKQFYHVINPKQSLTSILCTLKSIQKVFIAVFSAYHKIISQSRSLLQSGLKFDKSYFDDASLIDSDSFHAGSPTCVCNISGCKLGIVNNSLRDWSLITGRGGATKWEGGACEGGRKKF